MPTRVIVGLDFTPRPKWTSPMSLRLPTFLATPVYLGTWSPTYTRLPSLCLTSSVSGTASPRTKGVTPLGRRRQQPVQRHRLRATGFAPCPHPECPCLPPRRSSTTGGTQVSSERREWTRLGPRLRSGGRLRGATGPQTAPHARPRVEVAKRRQRAEKGVRPAPDPP